MPTRRSLIKAAGLMSIVAASPAVAAPKSDEDNLYTGPREMPRGLTLLSIKQSDGDETLGVKTARGILDVAVAADALDLDAPMTLEEMLLLGNASQLEALVKAAGTSPKAKDAFLDESKITFGRLFTNPSKIICVGLNYKEHVEETGMKLPTEPILFNKYNNTLAAHQAPLKVPPQDVTSKLDYETELLVVIGKPARNIAAADALSCVAGYCVGHDFSARDLQLEKGGQWMIGKTLDGFAPIGPYFVSADLVGDPNALHIETKVNGEVRQSSNTKNFIFNVQAVVAYASKLFTLNPGDIIFTGTPPGVIVGKPKDKQVWLKAGDKIESTVEKLGTLTFTLA
jgi:2-keto-4-pentenoate hydratase/2-oxohepta-3-ene-1,7-dioic acid hydratase in catechol pathway